METIETTRLQDEEMQNTAKNCRIAIKAIVVIAAVGLLPGAWDTLSSSDAQTYEIRPEIELGPYGGDPGRVLAAYERLMERYHELVQANLLNVSQDTRKGLDKLDRIEKQLENLDRRLGRMEKAREAQRANPAADR